MALNILGSVTIDATAFYSNNVLADVTGSTLVVVLNKSTQVLILASARSFIMGDEIPLDGRETFGRFGFSVDSGAGAVDYDGVLAQHDVIGSTQGYSRFPAMFYQILTLAAGTHTIKLRGKTQNGTVTGSIEPPIRLTVIG